MTDDDVIEPDLAVVLALLLDGDHSVDDLRQMTRWHPSRVQRALGFGLYRVPALISDAFIGLYTLTEDGHTLARSLAEDRS